LSETPLPADRYLDREISWLQFNDRVLDLARDRTRIPLIERAKFLAIFSSNLDEFFMVRVAGLKRRIAAGVAVPTVTGKMPGELHAELLAKVGLTGRFGCLGGELIDLRGQTIDLPLELLVLGRQRTIAFLCLGKLGGRGLSGLSGLVSRTSCLLGGGLQRRVLLLQGLDLSIQLGNLGIESCDIRAKRLRGLSAGNCLLAKGFHRLGYLIEEVIDFIDVIAFLEPYGLESMLPNIFRRQQSHKSLHLALGLMPCCCCFHCSTLARDHRFFAKNRHLTYIK